MKHFVELTLVRPKNMPTANDLDPWAKRRLREEDLDLSPIAIDPRAVKSVTCVIPVNGVSVPHMKTTVVTTVGEYFVSEESAEVLKRVEAKLEELAK
jgi:hypothetical protein